MSEHKKQYKNPPTTFGKVKNIRTKLNQEQQHRRKTRRTLELEKNRKKDLSGSTISQNDTPKQKLLKWKAEQRRKKESQKKDSQKKPPFVVGIPHHHICSPLKTYVSAAPKEKKNLVQAQKNSNKKGITKATEKRLLAKAASVKTKISETSGKKKDISSSDTVKSEMNRRESFAPPDHKFNPPTGLSKIRLFGEISVLSENTSVLNELTESAVQEQFHPDSESIEAITLQLSGKETSDFQEKQTNSKASSSSNLQTDKLATKDTTMENPDVSADKISVEYFKCALNEEKNRLLKLCEKWTEIQTQDDITEDIRYRIIQAIGQTTMLIKNKFRQFHGLILDCEKNNNAVLITCTDLHGFWDTMYISVKDCDSRFAKLEKLRANHWQEDQPSSIAISIRSKEKIGTKKKVLSTRKSSLRTLILPDIKKQIIGTQEKLNKKNLQEINMDNDEYKLTPYVHKRTSVSNNEKSLEISRNYMSMYTSTPFFDDARSISSSFSTPLIAMKVSKLYNRSLMLSSDTMESINTSQCIIPDQTPRKSSMEKSDEPKSKSIRTQLLCKANLNDLMTKSFDRLEINQNSEVSSKKINENKSDTLDSDKLISIEENSKSDTGDSIQTVIEKTNNETLKLSHISSINSIKTPEESESSKRIPKSTKRLKKHNSSVKEIWKIKLKLA